MKKSTRKRGSGKTASKPKKPHPDFPLFPHATGRWAKKVRGRLVYFGKIADDPNGQRALRLWLDQKDYLLAGRKPPAKTGSLTVGDLCNRFLTMKRHRVETGELAESTFRQYLGTAKQVVAFFGKNRVVEDLHPADFDALRGKLAQTNKLVGLGNQITTVRSIFKYAYDADLVDRPVKFGPNFSKPSARALRKQRTPRMFEAAEIRRMLERCGPVWRAMILLGVNCGFGGADIGRLTIDAIDFETGWVTFPRPKTGAERRIPLRPETLEALREAIQWRRKPAREELRRRVFLTKEGESWHKETTRYTSEQFRKLLQRIDQQAADKAEANGEPAPPTLYRKGRGFYTLRHVFETIGGESCDQVAVDAIMGHERGDMASHYRERISDERLRRVTETVRRWLFDLPPGDDSDRENERPHLRIVG